MVDIWKVHPKCREKKSLLMYGKTGVLLGDEYASFWQIQIYSNKTVLCPWASVPGHILMLMVLPLKLLNWLVLGDCFGLFPWAIKVIYVLYISQGQILHMCMKSHLFEGLTQATGRMPVLYSRSFNSNLHPKVSPKFFLLSKKIRSSAGCLLSGHRFLILQVRWEGRMSFSLPLNKAFCKSPSHPCVWAQHEQCRNSKEAQAEREMSDFWVPVVFSHEV